MHLPEKIPTSLDHPDLLASLLPQTISILQRDFELSNIHCKLSESRDVFRLRDELIPIVEKTGGPGSEIFFRLLYRVDIPESRVHELLQNPSDQPIMARISEMLIIRALQKAWYRAKYTT